MTDLDLLPVDLRQLLDLFASLPDVRFPELDTDSLEGAVTRVREHQLAVAALEAQREAARQALEDEQEALLRKAHRLHAYLRVYAEADEALATKVNALSLPRLRKPAGPKPEVTDSAAVAPKKRRRAPATTSTLFEAAVAAEP